MRELNQRPHDFNEGQVFTRLTRERFVHEGNGANTPYRIGNCRLRLVAAEAPTLQAQQRRDGLQIVLHPVVDFFDGGVLGENQPVAPTQL